MSAATRTPPTSASASTPLLSTPHRHTESAVLDERVAEHELLQLRLKLEQAISEGHHEQALTLLKALFRLATPSAELLKRTKAGPYVLRLSRRADLRQDVRHFAALTIRKWQQQQQPPQRQRETRATSSQPAPTTPPPVTPRSTTVTPTHSPPESQEQVRERVTARFEKHLRTALAADIEASAREGDSPAGADTAADMAAAIEQCLFEAHGGAGQGYRMHFRSLSANLTANAELVRNLTSGVLSAAELVAMNHEQLASEQEAQRRQQIHRDNLLAAQVSSLDDYGMPTDLYACPSCGSADVLINHARQRQHRFLSSGDEDVKSHLHCKSCAHHWAQD